MISNKPVIDIRDVAATSLIFIGDIHGEFGEVLKNINMVHDSIQVYCGDIGMGFYKSGYYVDEFDKIQKRAEKNNCTIIFIRGNHDNPDYFCREVDLFDPNKYSRIWMANEWQMYQTIWGNILCQGGAISVDKYYRTKDVTWWADEPVQYIDPDVVLKDRFGDNHIDIVATHTAPETFSPLGNKAIAMNWPYEDIIEACDYERRFMQKILVWLKANNCPKYWFYGHFHKSYFNESGNVTAYGLNINEIREVILG